jgi:hypothetical protein
MSECLFWGKFWFENCTLLQKRSLSAGRGVAHPLPLDPPMLHILLTKIQISITISFSEGRAVELKRNEISSFLHELILRWSLISVKYQNVFINIQCDENVLAYIQQLSK